MYTIGMVRKQRERLGLTNLLVYGVATDSIFVLTVQCDKNERQKSQPFHFYP